MSYDQIAVLVPAYKPDERLLSFVDELHAGGFPRVVVVDDGGGAAYRPIFERLAGRAEVLTHAVNRGKGAALKTGIEHLLKTPGVSVVTADADGQHTPKDCAKVADALIKNPESLILGVRDKSKMPARSRAGNTLTCFFFGLTSGMWVTDTQTGLRGLPACELASFAKLEGDRYEYELNMLMDVRRRRRHLVEVKIDTIYIDDNASSHFSPLRDGARIYGLMFKQALKFGASSLLSAGVDYGMYLLLLHFFPNILLLAAQYGARAVSSLVNYFVNRNVVFGSHDRGSVFRYYLLVVVVAFGSYLLICLFKTLGMDERVAKIPADAIMFLLSYKLQQKIVFRTNR